MDYYSFYYMDTLGDTMNKKLFIAFLMILALSSYTIAIGTDNIWQYYSMDEAGSTAIDKTNTVNGTISSTTIQAGIIGNAKFFNSAASDYYSLSTATNNWYENHFSINVWIYPTAVTGNSVIISKWNSGSNLTYLMWVTPVNGSFRPEFYVYDSAGGYKNVVCSNIIVNNTWYMVTGVYGNGRNLIYFNGTLCGNISSTNPAKNSTANHYIGRQAGGTTDGWQGRIDEVAIFNKTLTTEEISDLYNNSAGNPYPFNGSTPPPAGTGFFINFISQNPANITDITAFSSAMNVTYEFNSTLTSPILNYSVNTTLSCLNLLNGSCVLKTNFTYPLSGTAHTPGVGATNYTFNFTENNIYPSINNLNYTLFSNLHLNNTLTTNSRLAYVEFLNLTINQTTYNVFEVMSKSNGNGRVYVCNDQYIDNNLNGQDIDTSVNCLELGFIPTTYNHTHTNSGHNLFSFVIINGRVNNILNASNRMFFVLRGVTGSSTNYSYISNRSRTYIAGSRTPDSGTSLNSGLTWSELSGTIDAHIHTFTGSEIINYYASAEKTGGGRNYTNTLTELIDLTNKGLIPPVITNPFNTNQSTKFMNITYQNATTTTPGTTISYYNITLLNSDLSFNKTIQGNNSLNNWFNYNVYNDNLSIGTYYIKVTAYDSLGQSSYDYESFNLLYNAELNVSAHEINTNITVANFELNISNGSVLRTFNVTNIQTIDIVKLVDYTLTFDSQNYVLKEVNISTNESNNQFLNTTLDKINSVSIEIYDEDTNTLITNLTTGNYTAIKFLGNATLTEYNFNTTTGLFYASNLTADYYAVLFTATTYNQRTYYVTITNRSTQTLIVYLSKASNTVTFTYLDDKTGFTIEGVSITVSRILNGTWTSIATAFSDVTGRAQFTLSTNVNYRFFNTLDGYQDKTFNLNPVLFTSYNVYMTSNSSASTGIPINSVDVIHTPKTLYNDQENNFTITFYSGSGALESYGYTLKTNCQNISSGSGSNAIGGSFNELNFNLTRSCASIYDVVRLDYYFTISDGTQENHTILLGIQGTSTNAGVITDLKNNTYGLGIFERILISTIITIMVVGGISLFSSVLAGLGIGLFVLGYLVSVGFIPFWTIAISLFVGVIIVFNFQSRS